jgi:hypothetical protein
MPWWRRERLHHRLAREGGLIMDRDPRERSRPPWDKVGIHGLAQPRRWDAVVTAPAPDLGGDEATFVVLPDGTIVPERGTPAEGLEPLAQALGDALAPPYRAESVRRTEEVWAVAARAIEVATLPAGTPGNAITISSRGAERTSSVDGDSWLAGFPDLERLARDRGLAEYVLEAHRLDGELWEVRVSAL